MPSLHLFSYLSKVLASTTAILTALQLNVCTVVIFPSCNVHAWGCIFCQALGLCTLSVLCAKYHKSMCLKKKTTWECTNGSRQGVRNDGVVHHHIHRHLRKNYSNVLLAPECPDHKKAFGSSTFRIVLGIQFDSELIDWSISHKKEVSLFRK